MIGNGMDHGKQHTTFVIESGIPVPKHNRGRGEAYPWDTLKVGACMFIPHKDKKGLASTVSGANKRYTPKRFWVCDASRDGISGARIFRVA